MPDNPNQRFAGGPEAKMFAIGQKPFKGINTQVPRDSIGDEEFSWLENMQPIGNSLYSMPDAATQISNLGSVANPIIYFYMYSSDQALNTSVPPAQYVFVAFALGNAAIVNAATGVIIDTLNTSRVYPTDRNFATPLPQATQFNDGGIAIVAQVTATSGYFAADSLNFYAVGDTAPNWFDAGASGTMPSSIKGVCIGMWQGRVWIATGITYSSSVPNDGTDWTLADGATGQDSNDPFIKFGFLSIQQANGFLYIFGDSSVNVISNIQSSGSPTVVTTFNNQNVDPQIGASWQNTVQAYGRGLIYANSTGVYALFGGAAQKVSDQLDGIFDANGNFIASLSLTNGPSSAVAMINNQRCYCLLVPLAGPFDSVARNALVVWNGHNWFVVSQTPTLSFINTQMISSMPSAWGTDGINLYKLFAATGGNNITKIWQTKLFNGSGMQITKSAYRIFARYVDIAGTGITETATVDSQLINAPLVQQAFTQTGGTPTLIIWQNASLHTVQFQNSTPANVNWASGSMVPEIAGTGLSVNARGNVIGWTATSESNLFILTEEMMIYQEQSPIGG